MEEETYEEVEEPQQEVNEARDWEIFDNNSLPHFEVSDVIDTDIGIGY